MREDQSEGPRRIDQGVASNRLVSAQHIFYEVALEFNRYPLFYHLIYIWQNSLQVFVVELTHLIEQIFLKNIVHFISRILGNGFVQPYHTLNQSILGRHRYHGCRGRFSMIILVQFLDTFKPPRCRVHYRYMRFAYRDTVFQQFLHLTRVMITVRNVSVVIQTFAFSWQ